MHKPNTTQASSEHQPQRITTPPRAHLKSPTTKSSESTTNSPEPQVSQSQRPRATSLWQPPPKPTSSLIRPLGNSSGFGQPPDNAPSKDGLWTSSSNKIKVPKELMEAAERQMEMRKRNHEDEDVVKKQ